VSLTDDEERDRKFLCRKLQGICRGVYEALCILLLIAGKQRDWRRSVPVAPCILLLIGGKEDGVVVFLWDLLSCYTM